MRERQDILISLRSEFVNGIINGTKRVELRRRAPQVSTPARVWIYEKAPVAAIKAMAMVISIDTLTPSEIWGIYSQALDMSRNDFDRYVSGKALVSALCIQGVHHLDRALSLEDIRKIYPKFHPPQFYTRLNGSERLMKLLEGRLI